MAFHNESANSFRSYMQHKNEKLYEQFEEQQHAAGGDKEGIFKGVCIFVNGFTCPSHLELKQMMARYGGFFVNYMNKDVTHIICANLPDSKLKLRERVKERDPKPVLLPEWITDSVKAGYRLPTEDYSLARLRDRPGQKALTGFTPQKATRSAAEVTAVLTLDLPKLAELHDSQIMGKPDVPQRKPTLNLSLQALEERAHQGEDDVMTAQRPPCSLQGLVGLARKLQQAQRVTLEGTGSGNDHKLEKIGSKLEEVQLQRARPRARETPGAQLPATFKSVLGELQPSGTGPAPPECFIQQPGRIADAQRSRQEASGVTQNQLLESPVNGLRALLSLTGEPSSPGVDHQPREVENGQPRSPLWQPPRLEQEAEEPASEPKQVQATPSVSDDAEVAELAEEEALAEYCGIQGEVQSTPNDTLGEGSKANAEEHHAAIAADLVRPEHSGSAAAQALPWQQNASIDTQAPRQLRIQGSPEHHATASAANARVSKPASLAGKAMQRQLSGPGASSAPAEGRAQAHSMQLQHSGPTPAKTPPEVHAQAPGLPWQQSRHLDMNTPLEVLAQDTSQQAAELYAMRARQRCDLLRGPPRSSREDPAFQDTYFSASRLHFIGSWKARNEALLLGMINEGPKPAPPTRGLPRRIVHIDMDCFFASVAALGVPALQGKPLCVSHSASKQGAGEVSSANYEARAFGIRAVMTIGEARRLCPNLIVMPYEFDKYVDISDKVYRLLKKTSSIVQPISCDEAFMDITGLGDDDQIVSALRTKIEAATGVTASAGMGPNMLLARLATMRAKPNGQFNISPSQADEELLKLRVGDLPGVGWAMQKKLEEKLGISSVADVRNSRRDVLQRELGAKSGSMVWEYAHGQDSRVVTAPQPRKSIGAQVYYGVRLDGEHDAEKFLDDLAGHLAERLAAAGVKGRHLTLKIKRKKVNAPQPYKFLGHGPCDDYSRSVTLPRFVAAPSDIAKEAKILLKMLGIPAPDIRGVGLTMAKLDNDPSSAAARTNAGAPAKGAAAPATEYNPRVDTLYESFFNLPAVKAAMPPGAPDQAAQSAQPQPKLPSRKPPGSRPTPKHGHVLDMLSRSGKKASEGESAGGSNSTAPAAELSASAKTASKAPQPSGSRREYTPLISRAGKRSGFGATFSSTSMARAHVEGDREADSGAPSAAQPPYRQARVMDLLNRPLSSGAGRQTHGAAHSHANPNAKHMHPPWGSAVQPASDSMQAEMHPRAESPGAVGQPDRSTSASPAVPDAADGGAQHPRQGSALGFGSFQAHQEPELHGSSAAQPDPVQGETIELNLDLSSPPAALPGEHTDHEPALAEAPALELNNADDHTSGRLGEEPWADPEGGHGEAASTVQHNQLAGIDAATWARLPADVQASILAGNVVDLANIQSTPAMPVVPAREQPLSSSTPIQALPPASAIDLDVLDALPLHLKRELERAYGVGTVKSPSKRRRGAHAVVMGRPPKRQRALPETLKSPIKARVAVGRLTMSQVDPAVFAELPPDVAAELALALPPSHAAFFSEGNIPPDPGSPLPVGAEIGAAPQSDARAKAAAKKLKQSRLGPDEDVRQVWQSLKSVLEDLDQQCWSEDESEAMQPEPEQSMGPPDNGDLHSEAEKGKGAPGIESGAEQGASDAAPHAPGTKDGSVGPMDLDAADHSNARQSEQQGLGRLQNAEEVCSAPQKLAPVMVRLGSVCEVVLQWGHSLVGTNLESLQFLLLRLRSAARQHKAFAGQLDSVSEQLEADVAKQYGGRICLQSGLLH